MSLSSVHVIDRGFEHRVRNYITMPQEYGFDAWNEAAERSFKFLPS
jgi:hypothetical protein